MKLFSILIRHCSPKDSIEGIVGYFIANNDIEIYNYIDTELMFGSWSDRNDDTLSSPIITRDDDENILYTEFHKEYMLRLRGDFNDPNADYSDAYYGITHYGWSEGKEITVDQYLILIELGVAKSLN